MANLINQQGCWETCDSTGTAELQQIESDHAQTGLAGEAPGSCVADEARNPFVGNALRVLRARYLIKDETGQCVETPQELFRRVAKTMADVELMYDPDLSNRDRWEQRFYDLMVSQAFMPNSPTLMNAGRGMGMLSACFVLPVPDSIDGIFDSIKYTALIQKAGGGTGFAFDELRPTGDFISSSGGNTSGPISFWRAFSEATNAIQQGAFRRGANMGMMNIHHPDILKFLHAKENLDQFTNYNISVKISDDWMDEFQAKPDSLHAVVNPRTGKAYYLPKALKIWEYDIRNLPQIDAQMTDDAECYTKRDIWNIIVHNAWRTGEPGVVFIDRINQANPTPHVGRMEATNPCGEQPLLPFEACNLGSINLAKVVVNGCTSQARVDWDSLRKIVADCTRFLDNVIDANKYPLPQIDRICKNNRKIGLGVMGFADALFLLGVGYNTPEGVAWGKRFMQFVDQESHDAGEHLARERGSFPNWEGSIWDTVHHRPMRNATCTTVAPTGTISMIAGCSCGIEPLFSLAFYRNVLRDRLNDASPMVETNAIFERVAKQRELFSEVLMDQVARDGTLAGIDAVPEDIRRVFVCAHDISPQAHVEMQAAFQRHCDASISKTINFPESATVADVEQIYLDAFRTRCKGVTVYRNGCRGHQPMALKQGEEKGAAQKDAPPKHRKSEQPSVPIADNSRPIPEPQTLQDIACAVRIRQMTPFGNMHVQITVNPKSDRELEVFAQLGKGGDLANSDLEAICRLTSLWLRSGGRLHHVIRQLKGIGSSLQIPTREGKVRSLGDALARALETYARAKSRVGLSSLLMGEYDPCELAKDWPQPRKNGKNGIPNSGVSNRGTNHAVSHGVPSNGGTSGGNNGVHPNSEKSSRFNVSIPERMSHEEHFKVICPDCQNALRFAEGCLKCEFCGFAQC